MCVHVCVSVSVRVQAYRCTPCPTNLGASPVPSACAEPDLVGPVFSGHPRQAQPVGPITFNDYLSLQFMIKLVMTMHHNRRHQAQQQQLPAGHAPSAARGTHHS